ncbi:unnamed protein product, partial [Brassica oleracea var. botrytis]
VADLGLDICFTHSYVLSDLDHVCLPIDADRFRHLKAPFNCNFPTNDVDVVGHMKLLNGQMLIQRPVLHEVAIATTQRVLIHLQTKIVLLWFNSVCISLSQNSYNLYKTFPGTPSTGLATVERDPSCQPITKTEFDIERRKVTKEAIMELISREITEYHTQLLMDSSFIYQKS